MPDLAEVAGAVTAVAGFEQGSGKTSFLDLALACARAAGPAAAFTIGVDGAGRGGGSAIHVAPGDVVMTTEAFARASDARFELLEAVPGRTGLGHLLLGRAVRAGSVTLVGPAHLSTLAEAIARVREEGWAPSVLVDGAVGRITQAGALGEAQFVFTVRVDPANLARASARLRALAALAALPEAGPEALPLRGPVTLDTLKAIPEGTALSAEDFTRFFMEPLDVPRVLDRYRWSVARRFRLLGFAASLRGVTRPAFLRTLGPAASGLLSTPFEEAP